MHALQPLDLPNADLLYDPRFLSIAEQAACTDLLLAEIPWQQQDIRLYGRAIPQPRLTCWMGDPGARYAYSGLALEPRPWTPTADALRRRIEDALGDGVRFNSVLANLYRDGDDSVSWHADNEPELGPTPRIASLSLGAPRRFQMRARKGAGRFSLDLDGGSLLVMAGPTQAHWVHQVPKTRRPTGPRINLTFRIILPPAPGAGAGG